jgi:lipopolysaccharide export system permease protein
VANRRVFNYIFFEIVPSFVLGNLAFIFILLMVQVLRLTEFVLVHGIKITTILNIVGYLSVSFLPVILPMSLLFAILLTYSRLSQDSEVVALKSVGVSDYSIFAPALVFSIIIAIISSYITYILAPWGNRQFELTISQIGQTKAATIIREGTFSEGFFNLVVYANKVDSKTGKLKDVFLYDERNPEAPVTIIAKQGDLIQSQVGAGLSAKLNLVNGEIHKKSETHTKVKFKQYEVNLYEAGQNDVRNKSLPSYTYDDLMSEIYNEKNASEQIKSYKIELHKRIIVSSICIIFGLLAASLGTSTNRRKQKGSSWILSIMVIVGYWILYLTAESTVRSNAELKNVAILWIPNLIFIGLTYWSLRRKA